MKNKIQILSVILLLSAFIGFASYSLTLKMIMLMFVLGVSFHEIKSNETFSKCVLAIYISVALSAISSLIYEGQAIVDSIGMSFNVLTIGCYFFFIKRKYTSKSLFEMAILVGKVTSVLYVIRYLCLQYGIVVGGFVDEFTLSQDASTARLRIACSGFMWFLMFYSLYRVIRKHKISDFIWFILPVLCIFLMTFRTMLVVSGLCIFILLLKMKIGVRRLFVSLFIIGAVLSAISFNNVIAEKINLRVEENKNSTFSNKDYIRVVQWKYFTESHFANITEHILGSGMPERHSQYGKKIEMLKTQGIFYVDWGIIGLSWMIGILALIGIVSYLCYGIKISWQLPPYFSVWLIFMLLISVTTAETIRDGNFIAQAIILALISKIKKNNYEGRNINISQS